MRADRVWSSSSLPYHHLASRHCRLIVAYTPHGCLRNGDVSDTVGFTPHIYLLSAPLTILLQCCQINSFRGASRGGEAMARRRKAARRAGTVSRGIVSNEAVSPPVCSLWGVPARGPPWTPAVTLPHGCDGLSARRTVVVWTSRGTSLGRHVRRALLRNAWLDCTPLIPATTCHQSNYIETYSRWSCFKSGDDDFYGFDLQGVLSIHIHV